MPVHFETLADTLGYAVAAFGAGLALANVAVIIARMTDHKEFVNRLLSTTAGLVWVLRLGGGGGGYQSHRNSGEWRHLSR